jgi:hypothetical protein
MVKKSAVELREELELLEGKVPETEKSRLNPPPTQDELDRYYAYRADHEAHPGDYVGDIFDCDAYVHMKRMFQQVGEQGKAEQPPAQPAPQPMKPIVDTAPGETPQVDEHQDREVDLDKVSQYYSREIARIDEQLRRL